MNCRLLLKLFLIGLLCNLSLQAFAHNRSESFSEWSWREGRVSYSFSVLQREATRIPSEEQSLQSLNQLLADYLAATITVTAAGEDCSIEQQAKALSAREGYLRVEGIFFCDADQAPVITVNSFFELLPTHTHYAKVRSQGRVTEFLLTTSRRTQTLIGNEENAPTSLTTLEAFSQYLWIGAEHIVGGVDHLAFLLGLILLAAGWKEMAWLITGFTIGHSISLALAVLGVAQPNSVMVEALIGFTIVLVVIEAVGERTGQLWRIAPCLMILAGIIALPLWWASQDPLLLLGALGAGLFSLCYLRIVAVSSKRALLRLLITTTFGLIHGFGFAGGLLETGFPAEQMAFVLLGFNLGVELGQLLVLAVVIAAVVVLQRQAPQAWLKLGTNAAVVTLSALGTFWFVSRLLA